MTVLQFAKFLCSQFAFFSSRGSVLRYVWSFISESSYVLILSSNKCMCSHYGNKYETNKFLVFKSAHALKNLVIKPQSLEVCKSGRCNWSDYILYRII